MHVQLMHLHVYTLSHYLHVPSLSCLLCLLLCSSNIAMQKLRPLCLWAHAVGALANSDAAAFAAVCQPNLGQLLSYASTAAAQKPPLFSDCETCRISRLLEGEVADVVDYREEALWAGVKHLQCEFRIVQKGCTCRLTVPICPSLAVNGQLL